MKKYLFLIAASLGLFLSSCEEDKKETINSDNNEITIKGEWQPTTIELIKMVPVYTLNYPHTQNCTKDYLQIKSNNSATFFRFEGTECVVTEYADAFKQSGNTATINIMGYTIVGDLTEDDTELIITSDIDQYAPLIKAMYPEYEQYLEVLQGGTVKLKLVKK